MLEFLKYFFGQGSEIEFRLFTLAHILPVIVAIAVILLIYKFRNQIASFKYEKVVRMTFGFILIITEMSYYWRIASVTSLERGPLTELPISICGWVLILSSFLVNTKSQTLYDIVYFWLFSGTLLAVITPTAISYTGPTRFRYYQFWMAHTFGYVTLMYMTFIHKMRPTWKSMAKSGIALFILAMIATFANNVLGDGANYLYMATVEDTASLLNILPKNYWLKMLVMAVAVGTLFVLSYLPWLIKDKKAKKEEIEKNIATS